MEQMEMDLRLDSEKTLKRNMEIFADFTFQVLNNEQVFGRVWNANEGYGIASQEYVKILKMNKFVQSDMKDLLKVLPDGDGAATSPLASLYNSAVQAALANITLAAQAKRVLSDLYNASTPIEEMLEAKDRTAGKKAQPDAEDDFEETEEEVVENE